MSSSASPSAPASERRVRSVGRALALAGALALVAPALAQAPEGGPSPAAARLIVVDWDRALAQSEVGRALDALERNERRAARAELDALKAQLEAEEAELTALRDQLAREEFDQRVRDFDQRVRRARRSAQEISASLQSRFTAARESLRALALPELQDLMTTLGADVALDARRVLVVASERDATDALVARLDAAHPAQRALELLAPAAPPPPPEGAAP